MATAPVKSYEEYSSFRFLIDNLAVLMMVEPSAVNFPSSDTASSMENPLPSHSSSFVRLKCVFPSARFIRAVT